MATARLLTLQDLQDWQGMAPAESPGARRAEFCLGRVASICELERSNELTGAAALKAIRQVLEEFKK